MNLAKLISLWKGDYFNVGDDKVSLPFLVEIDKDTVKYAYFDFEIVPDKEKFGEALVLLNNITVLEDEKIDFIDGPSYQLGKKMDNHFYTFKGETRNTLSYTPSEYLSILTSKESEGKYDTYTMIRLLARSLERPDLLPLYIEAIDIIKRHYSPEPAD